MVRWLGEALRFGRRCIPSLTFPPPATSVAATSHRPHRYVGEPRQVAGYAVEYEGLTFATVKGAGHMVRARACLLLSWAGAAAPLRALLNCGPLAAPHSSGPRRGGSQCTRAATVFTYLLLCSACAHPAAAARTAATRPSGAPEQAGEWPGLRLWSCNTLGCGSHAGITIHSPVPLFRVGALTNLAAHPRTSLPQAEALAMLQRFLGNERL